MSFNNYEGYLLLTKLRRWRSTTHSYYCVLAGQQLTYYTHHHDSKPRGVIDLYLYSIVPTVPTSSALGLFSCSSSKAPSTLSFQLITNHGNLHNLLVTAQSTQAKEDWLEALNSRHLTPNTVLEKWLERFELSCDSIVSWSSSPPAPPSPTLSTTSSTSSVVVAAATKSPGLHPTIDWSNSSSTTPPVSFHKLIARQSSAPALASTSTYRPT